jgi:putative protein-disulfide isomerase
MSAPPVLWYFADPMCSWCWGFAPVIEAIKDAYRAQVRIALILGGLRPGTMEPLSSAMRAEILEHWEAVQELTGQPFAFTGALPEGFVYDTEPACRAVVTVGELQPEATFTYLKAVQAVFYAQGQDVTQEATLAALAQVIGIDPATFHDLFDAPATREKTQSHFRQARRAGVRAFPTLVMQAGSDTRLLTQGYRPFAELREEIDAWLA